MVRVRLTFETPVVDTRTLEVDENQSRMEAEGSPHPL